MDWWKENFTLLPPPPSLPAPQHHHNDAITNNPNTISNNHKHHLKQLQRGTQWTPINNSHLNNTSSNHQHYQELPPVLPEMNIHHQLPSKHAYTQLCYKFLTEQQNITTHSRDRCSISTHKLFLFIFPLWITGATNKWEKVQINKLNYSVEKTVLFA